MPQQFYTRSDGKRVTFPDDVTPDEVEQIIEEEEAQVKPRPEYVTGPEDPVLGRHGQFPSAPQEPEGLNLGGSDQSWSDLKNRAKDFIPFKAPQFSAEAPKKAESAVENIWRSIQTPIVPYKSDESTLAEATMGDVGKDLSRPLRGLQHLVSLATTPANLATMGGSAAAQGIGWAERVGVPILKSMGKAVPAMQAAEKLLNAAYMGEGLYNVSRAFMGKDQNGGSLSTPERLTQGGFGAAEALMARLGFKYPGIRGKQPTSLQVVPKPPAGQSPAIDPLLDTLATGRRAVALAEPPLQLPATTTPGRNPDFFAGPAGVASVGQEVPAPGWTATEAAKRGLLPQPPIGRVRSDISVDTTPPSTYPGTSGVEYTAQPVRAVQAEQAASNQAVGLSAGGESPMSGQPHDSHTAAANRMLAEQRDRLRQRGLSEGNPDLTLTKPPITGSPEMPWPSEKGSITSPLAMRLGGGAAGGAFGATQGDTAEDRFFNSLLYGAGGAFVGGQFGKKSIQPPMPVLTPRMTALNAAQNAAIGNGPGLSWRDPAKLVKELKDIGKTTMTNLQRGHTNKLVDPKGMINKSVVETQAIDPSFTLPDRQNAYVQTQLAIGGGGGQVQNRLDRYRDLWREVKENGMEADVQTMMNFRGLQSNVDLLMTKADDLPDIIAEINAGKKLPSGFTPESLAAERAVFEKSLSKDQLDTVHSFTDDFMELNQAAFAEAHQRGLISDETFRINSERANAGDFVPMVRILDAVGAAGYSPSGVSVPFTFLKKAFGSDRANVHPIVASMQRTQRIIQEANRNEASKSLFEMAQLSPAFSSWIKPVSPKARMSPDWAQMYFYDKGVRQAYQVPRDIAASMNMALGRDVKISGSVISSLLRLPAAALRGAATLTNPFFSTANVPRDISDYVMMGKGIDPTDPRDVARFMKEWKTAWGEVWNNSSEFKEMLEERAGFSTLTRQLQPGHFTALSPTPKPMSVRGVWDYILRIPDSSESATKLAVWKRLRKQGWEKSAAAYEVRNYGGSPDFARGGIYSPETNMYVMFLTAQIQGISRLSRFIKQPEMLKRAAMMSGLTALGLNRYNSVWHDEDGTLSITRTKPEDRQNYFMMVNPWWHDQGEDGKMRYGFFSIPKGPTTKILVNPVQEVLDTFLGQSRQSATQTVLDAVSNLIPGNINLKEGEVGKSFLRGAAASANPVIGGSVGLMTGIDPAWNTPIYGKREGIAAREQYGAQTSPTVKVMAQALDNPVTRPIASPFKLNSPDALQFLLEKSGAKSGIFDIPFEAADAVLRGVGKAPSRVRKPMNESPTESLRGLPIVGGFFKRFLKVSADQDYRGQADVFYKLSEKTQEVANTYNYKRKVNPEDADRYINEGENRVLYGLNNDVQDGRNKLSEIRTAMMAAREKGQGFDIRRELEDLKRKQQVVMDRIIERLASKGYIPNASLKPEPVR